MDEIRSNTPNAAKLISSLRNTGYDSYAAVEDIVDNSIDAQARIISINVEHKNKDLRIIIADNGIGMNEEILDEALKLGSITDKDEISDLGKYGMGLCTASISFSKRLEVLTKTQDGELLYSSQDLDEVVARNEFIKSLRPADQNQKLFFEDLVKENHGTIVILSKIDRLSDGNITQFASKLSIDMGRIYRKFIESGIEFRVNDKKLSKIDPLMIDEKETKVYSEDIYELPILNSNGKKEKIGIKIVVLPDMSDQLMKEKKINVRSQGFYVLRNNREIASGQSLDVFQKHNDFNRVRIELTFSASLDNEMGVRFSKDGIAPNQAVTDFLKQEVGGQIASLRKILNKERKTEESALIDHADSEEVIAKRAKLLITPPAQIEERGPRVHHPGSATPTGTRSREGIQNTKTSPKGIGARFDVAAMGQEGTLYECYQEGKIIIVRWNSDHPFYDRVLLANKGSQGIISALDYLVFALASAELKVQNEENTELICTIKSIMSSNLRALLS